MDQDLDSVAVAAEAVIVDGVLSEVVEAVVEEDAPIAPRGGC